MSEPFPLLSTTADQLHALGVETATAVRRRTKSTGHGGTEQDGPVNALHVKVCADGTSAGGPPNRTEAPASLMAM